MIKVYTKTSCPGCKMTKRWLTEHGFGFEELNTTERPELIDEVKAHGYNGLPVVIIPEGSWQGFRPDQLAKYLK